MITEDFESAMKMRYLEVMKKANVLSLTYFSFHFKPIVGFRLSNGNVPFRSTNVPNSSHRDVQCLDDHELPLDQVITGPLPKLPLDISIRSLFNETQKRIEGHFHEFLLLSAHWLAIEGKQPTINENPEIISKADLTADSLDPVKTVK